MNLSSVSASTRRDERFTSRNADDTDMYRSPKIRYFESDVEKKEKMRASNGSFSP